MKTVIDENIEYGKEAFGQFGKVETYNGREITNEILQDAEVLVVRSITNVNEELLKNTGVKFVGTTTIGTDHLDTEYLKRSNIRYASAPGCNSWAVAEYILTSLCNIAAKENLNLSEKTFGVVGFGNIGKKITRFAKALGIKVLVNDPPLERGGFDYPFSPLEEIFNCDMITFHVPMIKKGEDKTVHLLNRERINSLKPGTAILNSSRGAVVDNSSLYERLDSQNDLTIVLDVWENEPVINQDLLENCFIGTPHIAGYSLEGKVNGTTMIYDELCKFLDIAPSWQPTLPETKNDIIDLKSELTDQGLLNKITSHIYPIKQDSLSLKRYLKLTPDQFGKEFDLQRKNYPLRREFNNFSIRSNYLTEEQKRLLKEIRLSVIN